MQDWTRIDELPPADRNKVRWLIRHHAADLVRAGTAVKFGREWRVNMGRLPDYLRERTLAELDRHPRAAS